MTDLSRPTTLSQSLTYTHHEKKKQVGDPLKDTAGPSLHVCIKLLSTTVLVLGPLFISQGPK